jgi:histone-lysine N-methyltransferase SUV420H
VIKRTPRSLSRFKNVEASPDSKSPSVEPIQTPLKRKREGSLLTPTSGRGKKKSKKDTAVKEEEMEVVFTDAVADLAPPNEITTGKAEKVEEQDMEVTVTESADENPSPTSSEPESRQPSLAPSSNNEATVTDATSVDGDTIVVQPLISPAISKLHRTRGAKLPTPLEQAKSGATILVGQSTSTTHPVLENDNNSILSEPQSDLELDESSRTVSPKGKRKRRLPPPKTDVDHAPKVRVPGDYVLTSALLAEPASSWIVCKICEEAFVQKDAYFTRSSCPRCERHSKLYGYMWPKTDKEGKHDTEERVLDHRTVHRFVKPQEERDIRKRGRGSTNSQTPAVTRDVSEVVEAVDVGRRGRARRQRFTM